MIADLPGEIQFVEICKRITVFHRHSDRLLTRNEIEVPGLKPDRAEDMPCQPPFGFGSAPHVDQSPVAVMKRVADMICFRDIKIFIVRCPN